MIRQGDRAQTNYRRSETLPIAAGFVYQGIGRGDKNGHMIRDYHLTGVTYL